MSAMLSSIWNGVLNVLLGHKAPAIPPPLPIQIAGIYTVCSKLGLPKDWGPGVDGKGMIARTTSGRDALYRLTGYKSNSGVDWGWFIYTFERYIEADEADAYPRYC